MLLVFCHHKECGKKQIKFLKCFFFYYVVLYWVRFFQHTINFSLIVLNYFQYFWTIKVFSSEYELIRF